MPNVESKRPLPENHILLLSHPISLAQNYPTPYPQDKPEHYKEYRSILTALISHYGENNICVIKKINCNSNWQKKAMKELYPEIENMNSTSNIPTMWVRDSVVTIGEVTYVNNQTYHKEKDTNTVVYSILGEGGSLIYSGNTVLIGKYLWENRKGDKGIKKLHETGNKIGVLPMVNIACQRDSYTPEHIDGHAALIRKNNDQYLLVSNEYFNQRDDDKKQIIKTAKEINAEIVIVYDDEKSIIPLNILQSDDNTVICGTNFSKYLEPILGKNKIIQTDIPILRIPAETLGGIRCMTSTISRFNLDSISLRLLPQKKYESIYF